MPLFHRRDGRAEPAAPTGLVQRVDVPERLRAAAPSVGAALVDGLRPAMRLASHREPDAGMDVGQTKVGGAPDMPLNTPWPSLAGADGLPQPLQFFAQIDLAVAADALAAAGLGSLDLPAAGLLSFFADFDGRGDGSGLYERKTTGVVVLYTPPATALLRYGLRVEPVPAGQLLPVARLTWPALATSPAEQAALDALDREVDIEAAASLPDGFHLLAAHQLGGWARAGAGAGAGAVEELRPDAGWQMVLQIDSDENLEIGWGPGGAGTLWWSARAGELAADLGDATAAARSDRCTFVFGAA